MTASSPESSPESSPASSPDMQSRGAVRFPRSRRALGPIAAVGMLVIAGSALGIGSQSKTGDHIASTSAAAAQAESPPAAAMPSFAGLIERLKPAVVSVFVEAEIGNVAGRLEQRGGGENSVDPNSPFEFFFRQFGPPGGGRPAQRVRAQGSGFFISADGYLLTNNHVVDHARRVQIKTVEGRTLDAKVIGRDAKTDLAVLKVAGSGNFPFVRFAETPPRVGDWVLAMGNPFGLGGTVTAGIVSATGRDIGAGPYDDYLQIDAPVNKGNSGGPSFNMQGEVIGVNTAIYSPSGGSVGIAFDIPAATAKSVAEQLKKTGVVNRGWLGVTVEPVTADIAEGLGLSKPRGALIDDVQGGSPAAKAGLRSGDVIVSLGGNEIKDARDLARKIAELPPGRTLSVEVQRNGSNKTFTVTAAPYPADQARARVEESKLSPTSRNGGAKLGLYLAPAAELEGAGALGVVVMGVDPDGIAAETGLQQGDVILEAGGKAVTASADVSAAVDAARKSGKRSLVMRVRSADSTHFVALPVKAPS
jgi:serine protease Do